ncbi:MAG: rod shape-determining protein MreD [Chloroflexota bacterium]
MNTRTIHPGLFTALWLLPVLALLQTSMMSHFTIGGALPSLVLMAVVNWGILRGPDQGMLWGFIGGLCLDVFSPYPFGTCVVALVLVTSVVSLGGGTFIRTHALLPIVTLFAATVLYYLAVMFILESTQHPVDWWAAFRATVLPIAVYNAILNIPGYWIAEKLEGRVYPVARANW